MLINAGGYDLVELVPNGVKGDLGKVGGVAHNLAGQFVIELAGKRLKPAGGNQVEAFPDCRRHTAMDCCDISSGINLLGGLGFGDQG